MRIFNTEFDLTDTLALSRRGARAFMSPRRLANAARVLASERRRSDVVSGLPFAVMAEPSAVCDMKCPMCALAVSWPRTPAFLSCALYETIIGELGPTALFLNLWTWGEPLLNPEIGAMVGLATKKNIPTSMHTNGRNLRGRVSEQLIRGGLCYMVVSFDGATEETYGAIRGRENFALVRDNVRQFIELRKSMRSKLPLVEFKMIVTRENQDEIPAFTELGKQLGADRIAFRRLVLTHTPNAVDMAPDRAEYRQMEVSAAPAKNALHCNRPWRSTVILASGDVVPCCDDSSFEHVMGNINEPGGFAEIWNNDRYRTFRRRLIQDPASIRICSVCPENSFRGDIFIKV